MGKKAKAKGKSAEAGDLILEDVLLLGGDKGDIELVKGIDEDEEILESKEDFEADPIKKDEIKNFIKGLQFWKVMKVEEQNEPKKKLLKAPKTEEEKLKEARESESKTAKKKNRNKFKIQDDEISSTTDSPVSAIRKKSSAASTSVTTSFIAKYKPRNYILIKLTGKWYEQFEGDPEDFTPVTTEALKKLRNYTRNLMRDELAVYKKQQDNKKGSDAQWIRTVLASGTLGDKTAAYTLQIQESPVHHMVSLDSLVVMVKVKGRREALMAIDTLKELFMELLPDKKLVTFEHHPLESIEKLASGNNDTRDRRLLLWYFEEQLKERYATFVSAAQKLLQDQLSAPKIKVLTAVYELLAAKPEQEQALLSMIVNKLGDPDNKVAAKGTTLLQKLVAKHPNMKMVVVMEMERMLYRPNISERAQYYGICFLNQLILTRTDQKLASRLISIYFSFFKAYTKTKKNVSKMLAGLLSGVNRAFPFAKVDSDMLERELDTLYKTVHTANFSTAVQALMLLYHTMGASTSISDRYYQVLYRKLLDPRLGTSSKQAMFLNLIYKSLKKDDSDPRIKGFIKRLLQSCSHMGTNFICGSLMLLSEILHDKPHLLDIRKVSQGLDLDSDDELEHFDDVTEQTKMAPVESADNSEPEVDHEKEVKQILGDKGKTTVKASWVHLKGQHGKGKYDMTSRNPMYCNADRECVWELKKLEKHYHPTVTLFAKTLLKGKRISYVGDPLQDFTLIKFLDRFVYKNPKKTDKEKSGVARKVQRVKGAVQQVAVNTDKYLQLPEKDIPVDEKFYYRYFNEEAKRKGTTKAGDLDDDGSEVSDDEFDDFLEKYESNLDGTDAKFDFDFASEFGKQKKLRKERKGKEEEEESDFDLDEFDNLSDEEFDFGDDEDFDKAFESDDEGEQMESDNDGLQEGEEDASEVESVDESAVTGQQVGEDDSFDEEELAFSDDDTSLGNKFTLGDLANSVPKTGGTKMSKRKAAEKTSVLRKKKRRRGNDGNLYAAGEEFSSMMDENAGNKYGVGTEALSNRDNAHSKQLQWEADRDRRMKGRDWKTRKQGKGKGFQGRGKGGGGHRFKGKGKRR